VNCEHEMINDAVLLNTGEQEQKRRFFQAVGKKTDNKKIVCEKSLYLNL